MPRKLRSLRIQKHDFGYRFDEKLKQTPDSIARLNKWFYDAKFGVFIHFGVYSSLEGEYKGRGSKHRYSEWIQVSGKIPAKEYHEVAAKLIQSILMPTRGPRSLKTRVLDTL